MKYLNFLIFLLVSFSGNCQIEGDWHTSFSVMGMTNRMDLNVSNSTKNPILKMSDPDKEKFKDIKMDNVEVTDSTLSFEWLAIALQYEGRFNSQKDSIIGSMNQAGMQWEVIFTRTIQEKITVKRPQEPLAPFNYPSEDILIKNGDIVLGATLTLPATNSTNCPIVILASGSGAQNRNCELLGHKPFLVIADYLAKNGIGCLRFDDRGTGQSTGLYKETSLEDFGSDVRACVSYLSADMRFKLNPIGLAGHSEGGMHVLLAAEKNKKVKFVIELASVGTTGEAVLIEQQYLVPLKNGKTEAYAQWNKELYTGMCSIVQSYSQEEANVPFADFIALMYAKAPDDYKEQTSLINLTIGMNQFLNSTWGRQFMSFETKDHLAKLKVPILAINGSEDIQVPATSNNQGFENAFSKASKPKSKAVILPGLNHLMQKCTTCTVFEYGDLEETFSVDVLELMKNWIVEINK